jgi:hypothetical protein
MHIIDFKSRASGIAAQMIGMRTPLTKINFTQLLRHYHPSFTQELADLAWESLPCFLIPANRQYIILDAGAGKPSKCRKCNGYKN